MKIGTGGIMLNRNNSASKIISLLLAGLLIIASYMLANPVHPQAVKSFQKISSLAGGFVAAGGSLDDFDDFGESLKNIGDLDGDGVIDLAVGVRNDDDGGKDRGAIYILFMNTDGTIKRLQKISSTKGKFKGALDDGDTFGHAVTGLGDIDSDGVRDIAVGATRDDDGGTDRGAIWILFMNSDGTVKQHQKISSTNGEFKGSINDKNLFASDLELIGDFNGDGISDIAVSSEDDDDGGLDRGAFWLLFLKADGTVKQHQKISNEFGGFTGVLDDVDQFGQSVALMGDLDGDDIQDLAVAAERDDDGGEDFGAVWILFMNPDGTVKGHQKISATSGGFTGQLDVNDQFGQAVTAPGDLNGDGIQDLAVGAEFDDDGANKAGAIWLLHLNRNGTVQSHQKISSTSGNFTKLRKNSEFGQALTALGDLNRDGINDIAVSSDADKDGGRQRGAVYILFLNDIHDDNK